MYKMLVLLISLVVVASGALAQSDLSPKLKDQTETKVKPAASDATPSYLEQLQQAYPDRDIASAFWPNEKDINAKTTAAPQTDDLFDLQFDYAPFGVSEAGIESDGDFIYTSIWNGTGNFLKYDDAGNYVEEFIIAGAAGCRDIAYNGTYFYGGAASTTIFEMDFDAQSMVSTFTGPAACRAVAYNEDDDVFYCNNWSDDITQFDMSGANLGTFPVGPVGASYYGFAYQSAAYCGDGPFLWGYAQAGANTNELVQIELPTGIETGVYFDVGSVIDPAGSGIAGGLCIQEDYVPGFYSIIGNMQGISHWGLELCVSGPLPDNDLGVQAILSPSTGVDLTATEQVTIAVKNYGNNVQSSFDVWYTLDGGSAVTESVSSTINPGESYDHTFATTVDLSAYGVYTFEACVDLVGDDNPDNDCKTKDVENLEPSLCIDGLYTAGCDFGDGLVYWDFSDVNVPLIECDGTPYTWYHDYTDQIHTLIPGLDYTLTVQGGLGGEWVDVWIDFNDDLVLDEDELVLNDAEILTGGVNTEFIITIPPDATGGQHVMRARTNWLSGVTGSCDTHTYGNCLDFTAQISDLEFGHIVGNVLLDGSAPYNIGDVTEVLVAAGPYTANPDASGDYDITAYPGTYDVVATLYGYEVITVSDITVVEAGTETVDFTLPCIFGILEGTVTAVNGGAAIEGATVMAEGTTVSTTTAADGTYTLFIESGNYDFKASAPFYSSQTVTLDITELTTTVQDYSLGDSEGIIVVIDLDPTPNTQIVDVIQGFFPGGLVEYTTSVSGYPLDEQVQTVFLLLGVFSNNFVLTETEAVVLTTWLDTYGGNLYMEGGDTWAYDVQTTLHSYFNLTGVSDGTADLANIDGIDSFWSGFSWGYAGENNYIDHLEAIAPAIEVMENPDLGYYCGVAYDEGTYRTVGASFEVTGVVDGTGSFNMGIATIMGFFGYPVFTYGSLEGVVTENASGDPIEGALVDAGVASAVTLSDGSYSMVDVLTGEWDVTASKDNYHPQTQPVTIVEDLLSVLNFELIAPGSLEGTVTDASTGDPIEGADIDVGGVYFATTISDGTYAIPEVLTGDWDITCTFEGYNPAMANVTITEGQTAIQDFAMAAPEFSVDPTSIFVTLDPNATVTETITISNPGIGEVSWSASLDVQGDDNSEDMFDVIMDVPVGVGGGEAGIETDGQYIYTSMWNGTGEFQRYSMDGTWIETISVAGSAGCRDIAYDGTYFYGAAASTTIFEMDLANATMISTFTGPAACRAVGYNEGEDVFYCNNWSDNITKFDKAGANLGNFPVGPVGISYYGFAYDNYSGGEYLWGYAQTGATLNELIQIELPSGVETGLTFDVGSVANVGAGIAGGLSIDDHIQSGLWAFLGTSQNENIWALELTDAQTWILIAPTSGVLSAGGSDVMDVSLDATGLLPGFYYADINFSTNPDVGSPTVEVELEVEGLIPAINLAGVYNCTDVDLTWEMPAGGDPDSWNVYRDGTLLANADEMMYTDEMVDPEVDYEYTVTAVYGSEESFPTLPFPMNVPIPEDLEPVNPDATHIGAGDILVTWEVPEACLLPDEYDVYRDNELIGTTTDLEYTDPGLAMGFYEYFVVAVYYFGESGSSAPAYVLVGIDDISASDFQIYPNPASEVVNVKSDYHVNSIEVLNNAGQVVYTKDVEANYFDVNVSQFERGIYYFKLKTDDGIVLRKIAVK